MLKALFRKLRFVIIVEIDLRASDDAWIGFGAPTERSWCIMLEELQSQKVAGKSSKLANGETSAMGST